MTDDYAFRLAGRAGGVDGVSWIGGYDRAVNLILAFSRDEFPLVVKTNYFRITRKQLNHVTLSDEQFYSRILQHVAESFFGIVRIERDVGCARL